MMSPRKYSKKAHEKIGEVMYEFKKGTLKTSSCHIMNERKKAILIEVFGAKKHS